MKGFGTWLVVVLFVVIVVANQTSTGEEPAEGASAPGAASTAPAEPAPTALPTEPLQPATATDGVQAAPQDGLAPVVSRVPTEQNVVFLTIDDGIIKDPEVRSILVEYGLPASIFLTDSTARRDYAYFESLRTAGATVQNHTLTHPHLRGVDLAEQKRQICGANDAFESAYGVRPTLFRPPYGEYDLVTRQATAECGLKAVVLWREVVVQGSMEFQSGNHLQPGDIVLLEFSKTVEQDLKAFVAQVRADGMSVGRLEDWVR